jgi:hypothetical protein
MPAFRRSDRPNAARLTLHRPEIDPRAFAHAGAGARGGEAARAQEVVYWRVNGYRAAMLVWTDAEFERLAAAERPADAQHFSCGIWAVLRMV